MNAGTIASSPAAGSHRPCSYLDLLGYGAFLAFAIWVACSRAAIGADSRSTTRILGVPRIEAQTVACERRLRGGGRRTNLGRC